MFTQDRVALVNSMESVVAARCIVDENGGLRVQTTHTTGSYQIAGASRKTGYPFEFFVCVDIRLINQF